MNNYCLCVFQGCIDKYCTEEESGRLQRAHMKSLYLKYLQAPPKKKREGPVDPVVLGVTNAVAMQQVVLRMTHE